MNWTFSAAIPKSIPTDGGGLRGWTCECESNWNLRPTSVLESSYVKTPFSRMFMIWAFISFGGRPSVFLGSVNWFSPTMNPASSELSNKAKMVL